MLRVVNFIFVRNQDVYAALVSRGHENIIINKYKLLPIGVNQKTFYPLKKINKKKILFVGRIFKEKGVIDLLDLSKKYNEKITFVGDFLNEEFKLYFFDYLKNIKYKIILNILKM